jgi:hypothetical protein
MSKTVYNKSSTKPKLEKPEKIIPAFATARAAGGWVFIKLNLDENYNVLTTEVSDVNTRPIIEEKFKISVGKYWANPDKYGIEAKPA